MDEIEELKGEELEELEELEGEELEELEELKGEELEELEGEELEDLEELEGEELEELEGEELEELEDAAACAEALLANHQLTLDRLERLHLQMQPDPLLATILQLHTEAMTTIEETGENPFIDRLLEVLLT